MNVDVIDAKAVEPKRNKLGQYVIAGTTYRRVTTLIKPLDDTAMLMQWRERMVARGLVLRPDIHASVAATDPDDKHTLNTLCEAACDTAGASHGRNLGTALHELARRALLTGDTTPIPQPYRERIDTLIAALAAHRFTVVAVEQVCLVADLDAAGMFDIAAERDGTIYCCDIKTGGVGGLKWLTFAAQLACYANHTAIVDVANDTLTDRLDLDRKVGYILHLPPDPGAPVSVLEVDLVFGWEAAKAARLIHDLRKDSRKRAHVVDPPAADPTATARDALRDRIRALAPETLTQLANLWPDDVPLLKSDHQHTAAELDQIAAAVDRAEDLTGAPFPIVPDPEPTPPVPQVPVVDLAAFEGYEIPQTEYDELVDRIEWLTDPHRALVDQWAAEANTAGYPISLRQRRSIRRAEIVRGAIRLAVADLDPTAVLDDLGAPAGPTVGARLGQLTTAATRQLARLINSRGESV